MWQQLSLVLRRVVLTLALLFVAAVLALKVSGFFDHRQDLARATQDISSVVAPLPATPSSTTPAPAAIVATEPRQPVSGDTEVYTPETKWTAGYDIGSIPRMPHEQFVPLDDKQIKTYRKGGGLFWIAARTPSKTSRELSCSGYALVARHWDPATGEVRDSFIGGGTIVFAQTPVSGGQVFLSNLKCDAPTVSLLTADGVLSSVLFPTAILKGDDVRFADLDDHSLAMVVRNRASKQIEVMVLRWSNDSLQLEPMPALEEKYRNDFAIAALDADRLLVLGGSNDQYRGCLTACRAETHLLNLKAKTWTKGPSMLEPRSEFAAIRMPDGGILVAGGWTPTMNWNIGPSRTAERLNPDTQRFEPFDSLPAPNARHRFIKSADESENLLLAVDGMSNTAQAYDLTARRWFVATSWPTGDEQGGCSFMPFVKDGQVFAWTILAYEPQYGPSDSCNEQQYAPLSVFRTLLNAEPNSAPPESLLITYRTNAAFLPAKNGKPALQIGGASHTGMNRHQPSSAVDGFTLAGTMLAFPTVQVARVGGKAFYIGDDILVVGGLGDTKTTNSSDASAPMEWLSHDEQGREWKSTIVSESNVATTSAITQLANGNLLEVDAQTQVTELKLVNTEGSLRIERSKWPLLTRARTSGGDEQRVLVHQTADGRVIVAGGHVQSDRIAILKDDSSDIDSTDEYVDFGAFDLAKTYEIFDPVSKRWSESASSVSGAAHAVILDDGRVIKARKPYDGRAKQTDTLEISDTQGKSWQVMKPMPVAARLYYECFRMFVMDGELFASGAITTTAGRPDCNLEWFNAATGKWEELWRGSGFARYLNEGRVVIRKLANGKSMVIPVDGL